MSRARASLDSLYWCGVALLGAATLSGLSEPLHALFRIVPLDPNEGWNAFFQQIASHGGELYPAPGGGIINNYPPLSFYLVGAFGRLIGDNIIAGRLLALAGMLVVSVNVYTWLRAAGSDSRIALLAAGIFSGLALTYARSYAAINDPQWLAHAIMTTGLVVLWRGRGAAGRNGDGDDGGGLGRIVLGSLLVLAGGWTKHLLIPLPLALTYWMLRRSRLALTRWVLVSAVLLALSTLLVWWLYGAAFFESLNSARQYSVHQAIKDTRRALESFAPMMVLSVALVPFARRHARSEFAVVYFLLALGVAVAASGGVGVDINAYFDLMIAVSLCAALAVEAVWSRRVPGSRLELGPPLAAVLGAYLAGYAAVLWPGVLREWRDLDQLEQTTRAAIRLISTEGQGRAACETPELCYWAKDEFRVDFFNFGQRLKVGRQPLSACAAVFDPKVTALVQLDPHKGGGSAQLPAECNAVIADNYRPVSTSHLGVVLVPLTAAP